MNFREILEITLIESVLVFIKYETYQMETLFTYLRDLGTCYNNTGGICDVTMTAQWP